MRLLFLVGRDELEEVFSWTGANISEVYSTRDAEQLKYCEVQKSVSAKDDEKEEFELNF